MAELDLLHARSVALRRSALDRLAGGDQLDSGMLRLMAGAGAALAALDEEVAAAFAPERDGRAVVLDYNAAITLAVFNSDRQSAAATLNPTAALRLAAGRLLAAGVRRLDCQARPPARLGSSGASDQYGKPERGGWLATDPEN